MLREFLSWFTKDRRLIFTWADDDCLNVLTIILDINWQNTKNDKKIILSPLEWGLEGCHAYLIQPWYKTKGHTWWYLLRQNDCHFLDDILKCICLSERFCILIPISLKFVSKGAIGIKSASAPSHYLNHWWPNPLMHICVTQPQWVNLHSSITIYR